MSNDESKHSNPRGPVIPDTVAAGPAAVLSSVQQAKKHLGLRRSVRTMLAINQPEGFDCPGCAWPEHAPGERRHAEFCENGVKALAEEATKRRITAEFFATHSVAELLTQDDYALGQHGRLTEPMVRRPGATHYTPISWDDATTLIADQLRQLDSPNEAVFYTSGRASNEAAWCWQAFARLLGTNNMPDCSNLCHESSGVALGESIGIGKGSVSLKDFTEADLIVIMGQNPGTNHPRMLSTLADAKASGAKITAINPLPEAGLMKVKDPQRIKGWIGSGSPLADHFLQIRIGGDLALFQMVARLMLEAAESDPDIIDQEFIDTQTNGFSAWADHIRGVDWAATRAATGLSDDEIRAFAHDMSQSKRIIVCWAMGLTQHRQAVGTIREITNVLMARGSVGRPGSGLCPVRGHSNVQGDRTMGVWERPTENFLAPLDREFELTLPRAPGFDVVEAIEAMDAGRVKVFMALGGNFIAASPDTTRTARAMTRCELSVQLSTKLNRSHLITGDTALILPVLGRTEIDEQASGRQFVTVEDSMSCVHRSQGVLAPASSQLRSEVRIVCDLAAATLGNGPASPGGVDWYAMRDDYRVIRQRIARTIEGFDDFETRIADPAGFVLPHPVRDERRFATPSGKGEFSVETAEPVTAPQGCLLLQTLRSHDQFNTTVYGLDDRYRGVKGRRDVVFVHPDDLAERNLRDGDKVNLITVFADDQPERRLDGWTAVAYPTARGCAAAYFPEANVLVPLADIALGSKTPVFKAIPIRLETHSH